MKHLNTSLLAVYFITALVVVAAYLSKPHHQQNSMQNVNKLVVSTHQKNHGMLFAANRRKTTYLPISTLRVE